MFILNSKGRKLSIDKPRVMGIINLTPDSFHAASRFSSIDSILKQVDQMLHDGADILDIGGQSTRPGSVRVLEAEELERVIEPVRMIAEKFPEAFISIDTFYSRVANDAVQAGAGLVNDISAGTMDEKMIETVSSLGVPYVLMHMQGNPQTMQQNPQYHDLIQELFDFFEQKLKQLNRAGIKDIILDPGFGFGKTVDHNFELLRNLSVFKKFEAPLLLGISRKSMISKTLGLKTEETLNGTTVLNTIGLMHGATILRVHDVKAAKEAVLLFEKLNA